MIRNRLTPEYCLRRHHAISLLMANDPWLLDFLFAKRGVRLRTFPKRLIAESQHLPSQLRLLIRGGLDLWNGSGRLTLGEALAGLTDYRLEGLQMGISHLRIHDACQCQFCKQRDAQQMTNNPAL